MTTEYEMEALEQNMRERMSKNIKIITPRCKECGHKPGDIRIKPKR